MPAIPTNDGAEIFYKDWGEGRPVVFSHGWPLSADAWDEQLFFVASHGYRAIAHDRRGHGRSSQTWTGNTMDSYADDLAALIEALDLKHVVLVGHSTGGGEVTRYVGRYGTKRVAKLLLVSAIPPLMLKTEANPGGLPLSVFDEMRAGVAGDRSQFYKDLSMPFYGANRPGSKVSQGLRDQFWLMSMQAGVKGAYDWHQGLLRDGPHEGPEDDRRTNAVHPRRRRSDRPDRRLGAAGRSDRRQRDAQGLFRRPPTALPPHTRTSSTPISLNSSSPELGLAARQDRPGAGLPSPVPGRRDCRSER